MNAEGKDREGLKEEEKEVKGLKELEGRKEREEREGKGKGTKSYIMAKHNLFSGPNISDTDPCVIVDCFCLNYQVCLYLDFCPVKRNLYPWIRIRPNE